MKKMKRMASDSKIMLDKTFRRKLSEKKIQLLEQNFKQVNTLLSEVRVLKQTHHRLFNFPTHPRFLFVLS